MAILPHDEIVRRVRSGEIGIDPFDEQLVEQASMDLHHHGILTPWRWPEGEAR